MKRDLDFISGEFFDFDIPKEKRYLLKYFDFKAKKAFLRYYMVFGTVVNFTDHTGYYYLPRILYRWRSQYIALTKAHEEAKNSLTEEGLKQLQRIEMGKFPLTPKPKH